MYDLLRKYRIFILGDPFFRLLDFLRFLYFQNPEIVGRWDLTTPLTPRQTVPTPQES
jgi:hypothetical protein